MRPRHENRDACDIFGAKQKDDDLARARHHQRGERKEQQRELPRGFVPDLEHGAQTSRGQGFPAFWTIMTSLVGEAATSTRGIDRQPTAKIANVAGVASQCDRVLGQAALHDLDDNRHRKGHGIGQLASEQAHVKAESIAKLPPEVEERHARAQTRHQYEPFEKPRPIAQ